MSENERKELSEKLHFGLALAERRMLEEKALRNECIIQGLPNGEIKSVPARIILRTPNYVDKTNAATIKSMLPYA